MTMNKDERAKLLAAQKKVDDNVLLLSSLLMETQFSAETGELIADPGARAEAVAAAAMQDPLFSSLGPKGGEVAVVWAETLRSYAVNHNGDLPPDHLLSCAVENLRNLAPNANASSGGMLLSALNSAPMSTSAGIEIRANTAALVLPVMLANPLNEVVVYLPNPAPLMAEIFAIQNIAGSNFGDFKKNDRIGAFSSGQYSSARQTWNFQTAADGTKTSFSFALASSKHGAAAPIRRKSVALIVNNRKVCHDYNGQNTPAGKAKFGATEITMTLTNINYETGAVTMVSSAPLPSGTTLKIELEIDIEKQPNLTPLIDQTMESFVLVPFFSYLGADTTIQSTLASMSQFSINNRTGKVNDAKVFLANEKAVGQLTRMRERAYDVQAPQVPEPVNGEWKEAWELLKAYLLKADVTLLHRTERAGLTHIFASPSVVNLFSMMGGLLERPSGYQREARIHFAGTFDGKYRVFEVPFPNAVPEGTAIGIAKSNDIGRAAYITGSVTPVTLITADAAESRGMRKEDTLMSQDYDEVHPNGGEDFIVVWNFQGLADVGLAEE